MAHGQSHHRTGEVTRNGASRFAQVLADEHTQDQLLAALRVAIHSSCQRDRSAAQAVADAFRVDLATVYRWVNGELVCRPLQDFLDLQDAILAAKGDTNPAALELVRYVRARYLDPQPTGELSPALLTSKAATTMEKVGSLLSELLRAVDPASEDGVHLSIDECAALAPRFEAVVELVESLRLVMPACVRQRPQRIEVRGER